ncbi:tumor necrosis factor receptor superfamily member 17 [Spea bombifrons]|uniref:tumor necrosis factor receptor superfamily member 17 n=1 Tax=Spea bombifrons TaxID=233779 RepID=UPI00234A4C81|nr:tumor necrosis factor receptor superfamily member 17 [Spea bombifrons]
MANNCFQNHYYDILIQSCKPCLLRCRASPPPPCQSYCATNSDDPEKSTSWVIWFLLAFFLVLLPTLFLLTIVLRNKLKKTNENKHGGCFGKTNDKDKNELGTKIKDAVLESAPANEIRRAMWQNEEVEIHVCDNALSDYLFPLPAIEEGAAILVTTKTSACCNAGPGVRADAFVEI